MTSMNRALTSTLITRNGVRGRRRASRLSTGSSRIGISIDQRLKSQTLLKSLEVIQTDCPAFSDGNQFTTKLYSAQIRQLRIIREDPSCFLVITYSEDSLASGTESSSTSSSSDVKPSKLSALKTSSPLHRLVYKSKKLPQ